VFRAIDTTTQAAVIILDGFEGDRLEELRRQGHANQLRCPSCRLPVLVRAGEINRHHFAHKTKVDCPNRNEAPDLLHGRAVLYQWLRAKEEFAGAVTVEKTPEDQPEGFELPRPIDCWVERPDAMHFAFWIFARGVKRERYMRMLYGLDLSRITRVAVFLVRMLATNKETGNPVFGSTEKEAIWPSDYDRMYDETSKGSLHYLDAKAETLTTVRAITRTRLCRDYTGIIMTTPLASVTFAEKSGTFVHPGEFERLKEWRAAKKAAEEEAERNRQWLAQMKVDREAAFERERPKQLRQDERSPVLVTQHRPVPVTKEREGVCVFCGQVTTDWYFFNPVSGECECNDCDRKRRTG
jgi:hypothetical protein